MRLGKPPGTVTVLEGEEMDRHLRNHHGSVHELGLSDILDALWTGARSPHRKLRPLSLRPPRKSVTS
jgi:Ni,Fe-hydrogenase maturation factor